MLGLIVAFIGIALGQLTGDVRYDGLASILIGAILGATAIWLAYATKGLLVGESASPEVVRDIRRIAKGHPEIDYVNEIFTLHGSPEFILVNLSVDSKDAISADVVERSVQLLDQQIKPTHPLVKRVFIEGEARRQSESNSG